MNDFAARRYFPVNEKGMIYLALHNESQILTVPRANDTNAVDGPMRITFRKGGKEVVFEDLEDLGVNNLYYLFEVDNVGSRLVTGEYDYELKDAEGNTAGIGILTAGEYEREVKAAAGEHEIVEYNG